MRQIMQAVRGVAGKESGMKRSLLLAPGVYSVVYGVGHGTLRSWYLSE
jgi:hypothetical protein